MSAVATIGTGLSKGCRKLNRTCPLNRLQQEKAGTFAPRPIIFWFCSEDKLQFLAAVACEPTATVESACRGPATMEASASVVSATGGSAAIASGVRSRISVPGMISAATHVRSVVTITIPTSAVRVEVVMVVLLEKERSIERKERRIESPAERAVEDPVAWNERVAAKPRIPIPTPAIPSWSVAAAGNVSRRGVNVRFREIRRAQTTPAIQVSGFVCVLVEALRPR
jgi:hypothetical protein